MRYRIGDFIIGSVRRVTEFSLELILFFVFLQILTCTMNHKGIHFDFSINSDVGKK